MGFRCQRQSLGQKASLRQQRKTPEACEKEKETLVDYRPPDWPQSDFISIPKAEYEKLCQAQQALENAIPIVCTGKTSVAILSGDPDAVNAVKLLKQERDEWKARYEDLLKKHGL